MAIRELSKRCNSQKHVCTSKTFEEDIQECTTQDDHRLTLRIPRWLLHKIDVKRKERVGTISRNLWILERLEDAM